MLYSAFRLSTVGREAVKQCGRHMLKAKANFKAIHEVRKTVEDPTKGKYVLLLYRNR
jgi:acyl-CoA-binding protein